MTAPIGPEDRRKHLDFIQAVISRLAQGSSSAKNFSLTIAAAAFGFSALNNTWYLSLLGLAVVVSFSLLDANYLYQERLFRCLYQGVINGTVPPFSMDKDGYRHEACRRKAYLSWSVVGFYLPLLLAGLTVVIISLNTGDSRAIEAQPEKSTPTPSATASPAPWRPHTVRRRQASSMSPTEARPARPGERRQPSAIKDPRAGPASHKPATFQGSHPL